jgi:predicted dehydrogenase
MASVRAFGTLEEAVSDPEVALVIVTTHTDSHREPVERAVAHGRRVYLDKPISVTLDDAIAIEAAEHRSGQPIMMGFTRRYEQPWIEAVDLARGGRIGSPRMILLRSVIPYTRYLQLWHRSQARSGGALNDKGSHHFDVFNWIAGDAQPVRVTAMGGRSGIFTPDPNAPARCRECDRECPYRRHETLIDRFEGIGRVPNASWTNVDDLRDRNDSCVYLPGADIDDHAVVTVQYDSGLVATLFFAIFGPWSEDQETLEIVGDKGRLRMERHSGDIDLVEDYGRARSAIQFPNPDRGSSHFGADRELGAPLQRFMTGELPPWAWPRAWPRCAWCRPRSKACTMAGAPWTREPAKRGGGMTVNAPLPARLTPLAPPIWGCGRSMATSTITRTSPMATGPSLMR